MNPIPDDEELRAKLTPEEYDVLRQKGTEPAFTGAYVNEHAKGMYKCKVCGTVLFSSEAKFDSGTGWPSFDEPANLTNVELKADDTHGMSRTEVVCKNCGSHLGHVFDDLPAGRQVVRQDGKPAKRRYCINSVCLELEKEGK